MNLEQKEKNNTVRKAALILSKTEDYERKEALHNIAILLDEKRDEIKKENQKDILNAKEVGIKDSVIHRLELTDSKINSALSGINDLINQKDPIGRIKELRELDKDFILEKKTFPLGVIGMIFEARPDALIQIASLCLRSGNGLFIKGGKEAKYTNKFLVSLIKEATKDFSMGSGWIENLETHEDVNYLLASKGMVDLIIPRGSNKFVSYVMENTKIPVLGHADGICSIYIDSSAALTEKTISVIVDSKIQYPSACNAVETILLSKNLPSFFIKKLVESLEKEKVIIHGEKDIIQFGKNVVLADENDFDTEYLDKECAMKFVNNVEEAIEHINLHGSHHTDAIMANDENVIKQFFSTVDSADVFSNCSTRFADGFRFGLGAEVGISTNKIHARGPVGLDGLTTTKWILRGNGETVEEYSSGEKTFKHKDLI